MNPWTETVTAGGDRIRVRVVTFPVALDASSEIVMAAESVLISAVSEIVAYPHTEMYLSSLTELASAAVGARVRVAKVYTHMLPGVMSDYEVVFGLEVTEEAVREHESSAAEELASLVEEMYD